MRAVQQAKEGLIAIGLVVVLAAACRAPREESRILLQTNADHYPLIGEAIEAMLTNGSGHEMVGIDTTSFHTLRFYLQQPEGWREVFPMVTCTRDPQAMANENPILRPGETMIWENASDCQNIGGGEIVWKTGQIVDVGVGWTGRFILAANYTIPYADTEFVVFSNEFTVADSPDVRQPTDVWVTLEDFEQGTLSIRNRSQSWLCFYPFCADGRPVSSSLSLRDQFSTLQRQTDDGTWEIVPPEGGCLERASPTAIPPGEDRTINLWEGYPLDPLQLSEGEYRWEILHTYCSDYEYEPGGLSWHNFTESVDYGR